MVTVILVLIGVWILKKVLWDDMELKDCCKKRLKRRLDVED